MLKPAIVGVGVVGKAMRALLPEAVDYDVQSHPESRRAEVNRCDIAFVCVPTPTAADGSCDTGIVASVVAWLKTPLIVIRSTIAPGTTDRLRTRSGKRIVFQPEYLGETPGHPMTHLKGREFIVLGGATQDTSAVADFYKHYYHSDLRFYFCDALTAELAKYMENCFYAVKVTFCNEFFDLARAFGVDFNVLREVWLADPRISRDHTFVYPGQRGFGGKCLPKDLSALIAAARRRGCDPALLAATQAVNERFRTAGGGEPSRPVSEAAATPPLPPSRRRFLEPTLPEAVTGGYRAD